MKALRNNYDKKLINCNLLEQTVSSNFLTTLNSIPNKREFKMAFLNIVTYQAKLMKFGI